MQDIIELALEAADAAAVGKPPRRTTGKARVAAAAAATSASPVTWQDTLYDMFDASTLVVCGGVLALCVGSLLVLGGRAWLSSRS